MTVIGELCQSFPFSLSLSQLTVDPLALRFVSASSSTTCSRALLTLRSLPLSLSLSAAVVHAWLIGRSVSFSLPVPIPLSASLRVPVILAPPVPLAAASVSFSLPLPVLRPSTVSTRPLRLQSQRIQPLLLLFQQLHFYLVPPSGVHLRRAISVVIDPTHPRFVVVPLPPSSTVFSSWRVMWSV